MINDINSWRIVDEFPGIPLDKISPVSKRLASLIARNKINPLLKSNFLNIQGAVEMISGLDYHYDNFMQIISHLAQTDLDNQGKLHITLMHEVTAYLNRLGQFHYFLTSDFVDKNCSNAISLAPTIESFIVFRMKNSAHRSIDAPRKESNNVQIAQAMSMLSIGGKIFEPKPGQTCNVMDIKTAADAEEHGRKIYAKCYLIFQLITDDPNVCHNFSIEKEHSAIMREAFVILETLLK